MEPRGRCFWPACLLLALVVRAVNLGPVLLSGGVYLIGTDAYYHLRRIEQGVRHFPRLPRFDPYLGHPDGAFVPYETGFDLLLAAVIRLLSPFGEPSQARVMAIAASIMPFLGLLLLPLYAAVARELAGERAARFTAVILAVLPGVYFTSQLGQVDHHVLEPLLVGLPMLLALQVLAEPDRFRAWLWGAVSLGAGLFFWRGMILPAGILAAAFAVRGAWQTVNGMADRLTRLEAPALFAVAAVVALPFGVASSTPVPLSYFTVSLLQPLVLALLAASLFLMGQLCGRLKRAMPRASGGLEALAGGALVIAGLLPFVAASLLLPAFLPNLLRGLGFLARAEAFVLAVGEQRPLFRSDDGDFSLLYPVYFYGAFCFLAPLLALVAWRGMERSKRTRTVAPDFRWLLFVLWTLVVGVMALAQRRYASLWAPLYAVWLGMGLAALWPVIRAWGRGRQAAVAVAGTMLSLPTVAFTAAQAVAPVQDGALLEAMAWIRTHTPETAGYDLSEPGARPEYAVLAPWSEGHHLVTLARRPNVANPFGIEWFRPGLERAARFWLAPGPALAEAMDAAGARFALLSFRLGLARDEARFLGVDPDRYAVRDGPGWRPGPAFAATGAARLYLEDGVAGDDRPAIDGVRLIWEGGRVAPGSPAERLAGAGSPVYKLYERVAGARLEGRAAPGLEVTVTVPIETPIGRRFEWRQQVRADGEGRLTIVVPYATAEGGAGRARAGGPVRVAWPGGWWEGTVLERDVIEGRTLALPAVGPHAAGERTAGQERKLEQSELKAGVARPADPVVGLP